MKKIVVVVLGLLLVFGLLFPVRALAVEEVSSFELFWPIVAGRTSGDSLYWLKSLKENAREALIYSKYKKTDYNILMAEKRAVEIEKLVVDKKDYPNASKTLDLSKERRAKVIALLKELADGGTNTTDLKNRFMSSLENQKKLILFLQTKVTDKEAKDVLQSFLDSVNSDISKLR